MADPRTIKSLSITRAAAASATRVDLACSPDEDDVGTHFTRLLRYIDGAWNTIDLNIHAESLCQFRDWSGKSSLFVMSREGDLVDVDGGGPVTKIEDPVLRGKSLQLGFLYKLRQVGGSLYAAGSGGQVYVSENDRDWHVMDEALLDHQPGSDLSWMDEYLTNPDLLKNPEINRRYLERIFADSPKVFWSLAGVTETAIYAGGEQAKGVLYFWDGARFSPCELPTDKALRDIIVAPDGTVWICGREGLLLKGRDRSFDVVIDRGSAPRFASLAWFNDRLYIGSSSDPGALFVYGERFVEPVRTGLSPELADVHTVQAAGDSLWAVGMKGLARFDGQRWERIPVPGVNE